MFRRALKVNINMKLANLLKRRLINSFKYSIDGLLSAWRSEEALRVELFFFPLIACLALVLGKTKIDVVLMISSAVLVLIVELLNTGLEKAIDRISMDQHHLSKIVKDIGSAAVLLAIANWIFVWVYLLWF